MTVMVARPRGWMFTALLAGACVLPDISYDGRPCPCGDGYVCDASTNTCVPGSGSASSGATSPSSASATSSTSSGATSSGGSGGGGGAPVSAYAAAVLADGPVAYYRLGEDPASAFALDSAGDFDGAYTIGATRGVAGAIANDPDTSVELDGLDGAVSLPDAFDFVGNQAFSVEVWCRPTTTASTRFLFDKTDTLMGAGGGTHRDGYTLLLYDNDMVGLERWSDGTANVSNGSPASGPGWYHVVGTFDGFETLVYVNGAPGTPGGNLGGPLADGDTAALIGASFSGGFRFTGGIDEVAVYDFVLPVNRILEHYQVGAGL